MTHYHIFLPPPPIPALASDTNGRIELRELTAPSRESQESAPERLSLNTDGTQDTALCDSGIRSVLGKRPSRDDASGDTIKMPPPSLPIPAAPTAPPAVERRSSNRLAARTSATSISSSRPRPSSPELSMDSTFDTAATYPSQLAPSGMETSIYHFPVWSLPLHKIVPLQVLLKGPPLRAETRGYPRKELYSCIVCIVSVDPPVERRRKAQPEGGGYGGGYNGRDRAGGSLWIGRWMVTCPPNGGEGDVSCSVKLWERCAMEWGDMKVRRGDVVLLENVEIKQTSSKEPSHLVLTPSSSPKLTILYRTLPRYTTSAISDYVYRGVNNAARDKRILVEKQDDEKREMVKEDRSLRPDLRLGISDMGVRKVGEVVAWFAEWVGGEGPSA